MSIGLASQRAIVAGICYGLSLYVLPGCAGGARFVRTAPDPGPMTPRAPEQVAVWNAKASADKPVVQIGTIEGESRVAPPLTGDHSWEALAEIKQEAAIRGCDAVVPSAPEKKIYATSNGTPLYKVYQSAACLVFVPKPPAAPAQPAADGQRP